MEYKFMNTINGPVVVGEDEIVFFHQAGPLQDYIDSDPDFFKKAYMFLEGSIKEHADAAIRGLKEDIVGFDSVNQFTVTYHAYFNLKGVEHDYNRLTGFPGNNLPVH